MGFLPLVMADILYLVHRMPYPPNKGDKVRSFHLLRHLQKRHRVFLGTFMDDPADAAHVEALRSICPDVHVQRLGRAGCWARALGAFFKRQPISVAWFDHPGLRRWVKMVSGQHAIEAMVVVSSPMAPYARSLASDVPLLLDVVDVDSAKWQRYATARSWPMSWVYAREARLLLQHEVTWVQKARQAFFVSDTETQLFNRLSPVSRDRVQTMGNGVDRDYFSPVPARPTPFGAHEFPIVFVGSMDYWPNIDAATWFAREVMPGVVRDSPRAKFYIVGRNPSSAVRSLRSHCVQVTGTVEDVRPFLQHAGVVVAPLRVSPGLPNKVLEALSMGQPVVATSLCKTAVGAHDDSGLCTADTPEEFRSQIARLHARPDEKQQLGEQARSDVIKRFVWSQQLEVLSRFLPNPSGACQ